MEESIYDEFVAKCKAMAEMRQVGDPFDAMTQQGPQVSHCSIDHLLFLFFCWKNLFQVQSKDCIYAMFKVLN